jgi:hypothetical protein
MDIPEPLPDTTMQITSDSEGNIPLTTIWSQWNTTVSTYLPVGEYVIIVDVDNDGVYDEGSDVINEMSIAYALANKRTEAPVFIAPEFPGGSITAILAIILAVALSRSQKFTLLSK